MCFLAVLQWPELPVYVNTSGKAHVFVLFPVLEGIQETFSFSSLLGTLPTVFFAEALYET